MRELRKLDGRGVHLEELQDAIAPHKNGSIRTKSGWWKYYRAVTAKEIIKVASKAGRTTAACLNSITPQQYKK